jgi:hypothetical protein
MSQVTINHELATGWMHHLKQHLAILAMLGQDNPRFFEYMALAKKIDTRNSDTLELTDREVHLTLTYRPVAKLIQHSSIVEQTAL